MKRSDKIMRLAVVGFSATELTRMSNELLDATYEGSRPLMQAKTEELRRAIDRESRNARAKRAKIAYENEQRRLEVEWLRKWKPCAPISATPQKVLTIDQQMVTEMIARCSARVREFTAKFRDTGDRSFARMANDAKTAMNSLQHQLGELA